MSNYADRHVNDRMKAFFLSEDMADIYFNANEVTIYESALAWTKAGCTRKQLPFAENARTVLANALNFIRFPLMSIEEFTNGPANSGLLSDQETIAMYKWYGSKRTLDPLFYSTASRRPFLACNRFEPSNIGYHE
ncbi:BTB/POZ domain-containing protein 3-like protein [Aphelenchoides avenae]|nr:BTB/POZ domain-containing protein 3-like protein [Aphelenchus avenae]